jgi:hypothetical protein
MRPHRRRGVRLSGRPDSLAYERIKSHGHEFRVAAVGETRSWVSARLRCRCRGAAERILRRPSGAETVADPAERPKHLDLEQHLGGYRPSAPIKLAAVGLQGVQGGSLDGAQAFGIDSLDPAQLVPRRAGSPYFREETVEIPGPSAIGWRGLRTAHNDHLSPTRGISPGWKRPRHVVNVPNLPGPEARVREAAQGPMTLDLSSGRAGRSTSEPGSVTRSPGSTWFADVSRPEKSLGSVS